jgi:hypothetical protein
MIKDPQGVEKAVNEFERSHVLTLEKKFALLDSLYHLAKQFGHFSPARVLGGIEDDIKLARDLNACLSEDPCSRRTRAR